MGTPLADAVRAALAAQADATRAGPMQAYMKSAMPFLGMPTPLRRQTVKQAAMGQLRSDAASLSAVLLDLWRHARHREERYAALDLLRLPRHRKLVALLLLQLPSLKAFWQRALRSQRFALLRRVLPQVWPLDLAPLPAGTTISGLGLSRWQDLPRLVAQGRCFEFVSLETGEHTTLQAGLTPETWQTHLDRASSGRWVLIEHVPTSKEGLMWASWSTHDGWVDLTRLQSQPSVAVN